MRRLAVAAMVVAFVFAGVAEAKKDGDKHEKKGQDPCYIAQTQANSAAQSVYDQAMRACRKDKATRKQCEKDAQTALADAKAKAQADYEACKAQK